MSATVDKGIKLTLLFYDTESCRRLGFFVALFSLLKRRTPEHLLTQSNISHERQETSLKMLRVLWEPTKTNRNDDDPYPQLRPTMHCPLLRPPFLPAS